MSKIFLTGMTSSHTSKVSNERHMSFAGLVYRGLEASGHEVTWGDPTVNMTTRNLETFDAIVVGLSPITSLSANRAYGALNVIGALAEVEDPRLSLFFDAPEPKRITQSLKSVSATPDNLVKPFFSYRKEYKQASESETKDRLLSVVNYLLEEEWPNTFYPRLPWETSSPAPVLPTGATRLLEGVYLDSLVKPPQRPSEDDRDLFWVVDRPNTGWAIGAANGLILPAEKMQDHKYVSDSEVSNKMKRAVGSLISPERSGDTWWTYRFIQSMQAGTPIATNWRESQIIGNAWSYLPSSIEAMTQKERNDLSVLQYGQYMQAIYSEDDAKDILEAVVKLSR